MPCGPVLGWKGGTALQVKPSVGYAYLTTHAVMLKKTQFYQVRISTTLHDNEKLTAYYTAEGKNQCYNTGRGQE